MIAHWKNSSRVDMSLHSDALSWFRARQSFLLQFDDACLAEKLHLRIS